MIRLFSDRIFFLWMLVVLASLCLTSCRSKRTHWVNKDGFRLLLPDQLEETEQLSPSASWQYQSHYRELYLLGQTHSWEEIRLENPEARLEEWYDFHIENLLLNLQEPNAPGPDSVSLHGLTALSGSIEGLYKGDPIHYRLVVISGETRLYQLLIWTLRAKLPENEASIQAIIDSFEEA